MSREHAREVDAEFVLGTVRHRSKLIALFAVLGLVGGILLAVSQPPMATATTQIYVYPLEGNPYAPTGSQDSEVSLDTEAQIVSSDEVVGPVADKMGIDPDVVRRRLSVTVPTNTQLLDISYQAPKATDALGVDKALSRAYLIYRRNRANGLYARRVDNIDARINQVNQQLQKLANLSQTAQAAPVNQAQRRSLSAEMVNLRAQRVDLVTSKSQSGRVISRASVSDGSRIVQIGLVLAGLLVGLVIGLSLALALERRRGRVWGVADVRAAGLPVLVDLTRRGKGRTADLDVEVRRLRATVLDAAPHRSMVAVCGYGPGGDDADIAPALAASLARTGMKVLLVDAQSPAEEGSAGLAQVLAGHADAASLATETDVAGVWSLSAGHAGGDVADYFVREVVASGLRPAARQYDYTIVRARRLDTPEGEAVAQASDLVVLTMFTGVVLAEHLAQAVDHAALTDTRILGTVLLGSRDAAGRAASTRRRTSPPSSTVGGSGPAEDRSQSTAVGT